MTAAEQPTPGEGLWVTSEILSNGQYGVGLSLGADRAWSLNRKQALAYAATVVQRSIEAEHDTAVFRLLTRRLGMEQTVAASVLLDVRTRRGIQHAATSPLQLSPGVGLLGPFVIVGLDGKDLFQLTPVACRRHATGVLEALSASGLDNNLHQVLVGQAGVPDHAVRGFINDLADYWPVTSKGDQP